MEFTHKPCSLSSHFEHTSFTDRRTAWGYHPGMNQKELGERLKRHRSSHPKISTYELAEAAKYITPAGITNKERGIRAITRRDAEMLADALTRLGKPTSAAYLLGMDDKPTMQYSGGGLNPEVLEDCIRIFEEMLPASEFKISPKEKAKIIEGMYRRVRSDGSIQTADVVELIKPITDRYTRWDNASRSRGGPADANKRRGEPGQLQRVRKLRS